MRVLSVVTVTLCVAALAPAARCAEEASGSTGEVQRIRLEPVAWPTPEMLTPRGAETLRQERRIFAGEIRNIKKWKPNNFGTTSHAQDYIPEIPAEETEKIVTALEKDALDTVDDNVRRFRAALAARIPTFAKAMDFYRAGDYLRARDTTEALTKEKILLVKRGYAYDTLPPLSYCAVTHFEAEAFGLAGALQDSVIRYQIVSQKMRGNLTFSATARMRAGLIYEQSGRGHFAIPLYKAMTVRYVGLFTPSILLQLQVQCLRMTSEDSFSIGAAEAGDSARRLARTLTGETTQKVQNDLVSRMTAMLIEEETDPRYFMEYQLTLTGQEIEGGRLQPGEATAQFIFTNDTAVVGSDDWGQLRPREKQELLQIFQETYSERYREMLEQYYRNVSAAENKDAEKPK